MPFVIRTVLAAFAAALALAASASAQLKIDINRGTIDPLPIAIPNFSGDSKMGPAISGVITSDLTRSGLFRTIDPASFIEKNIPSVNTTPNFGNWKILSAKGLLVGSVGATADGRLKVDYRLWDVLAGEAIGGQSWTASPDDWRRIAHKISDDIYAKLTGEKGYFDTHIVFIDETGSKERRIKRLTIMDQDGANPHYLTGGDYQVITPRFSPNAQRITFVSFANGPAQVYLFDIETGRSETLGKFPSMTIAPRFTTDGNSILYAYPYKDNWDIYMMDLATRAQKRLTNSPGIDVSPSMSPDGKQIVFTSDRGGSQQLYVMSVNGEAEGGSGATRISREEGHYSEPVWSPRGDLIAFTKYLHDTFYIGVMRPDGSGERLLTTGKEFIVESPTWSPNGRVILYTTGTKGATGTSEIRSIDLTGTNELHLPTPTNSSDPAWSPLLP
jgi:TolB protein